MSNRLTGKRIGVICGGSSSERTISLLSGSAVFDSLKAEGLNVIKIDILKNPWRTLKNMHIDVAFVALHGTGGEDGGIQRTLETLAIPYTGSDVNSSLNAFNKIKTKRILSAVGIPVPRYAVLTRKHWRTQVKKIAVPCFIKPVSDGSSIGVFLIRTRTQLEEKLKKIFKTYRQYLIEERIVGREITIGILEKRALPIIELQPTNMFYDFKAKYTMGKTNYLVPAKFPEKEYKYYQSLALKTHRALGARDFSRVDMMIDCNGRAYVLELNSIPGFTGTSLLPKAARNAGIQFGALCKRLLNCALRRS